MNAAAVTPGTWRTASRAWVKNRSPHFVVVEPVPRLLHLHGEHVRRVEPRIDREQTLEAPQQQSRAHQQHYGKRNLGDDQRAARKLIATRGAPRTLLQSHLRVATRGMKRRKQPD